MSDLPPFRRSDWEHAVGYPYTALQARLRALDARCEAAEARLAALETWQREQATPAPAQDAATAGWHLCVCAPHAWLLCEPSALARSVRRLTFGERLTSLGTVSDGERLYARVEDADGRQGYVALNTVEAV